MAVKLEYTFILTLEFIFITYHTCGNPSNNTRGIAFSCWCICGEPTYPFPIHFQIANQGIADTEYMSASFNSVP